MTRTIIGLFEKPEQARAAVEELAALGIERDLIGLMAAHADPDVDASLAKRSTTGEGAGLGVGIGGLLGGIGGLVLGAVALAVPGFGVFLAAGPIAAMLAGIGVGAAAGGVAGALTGLGLPHETAHLYAEGVRNGSTLVTAEADLAMADRAGEVMTRNGGTDVHAHVTKWGPRGLISRDEPVHAPTPEEAARAFARGRELEEPHQGEVVPPVDPELPPAVRS